MQGKDESMVAAFSPECRAAEERNARRAGNAVRNMTGRDAVEHVQNNQAARFLSPGRRMLRASIAIAVAAMAAGCAGIDITGSGEASDSEGMIRATEYQGSVGVLPWSADADGCIVTVIGDVDGIFFEFEGQGCTVRSGQGAGNGDTRADLQDETE